MASRVPPIARVRLARSLPHLLAAPVVLVLAGVAIVAAAWLLLPGLPAIATVAGGVLVALVGLTWAIVLQSVRLDVEEAAVRLHWLGGERVCVLTAGPVTRVRLRGENASPLRARSGPLGYGLGRAVLRGEEPIEVVRLAPTPTAILIPTERGRVAVAAASEEQLLDALARAARARQRLEELVEQAPPVEAPQPPSEPEPPAEPEPQRFLTGIERALLEERLAEERVAAEAAAETERLAAAQAADPARVPTLAEAASPQMTAPPVHGAAMVVAREVADQPARRRRPTWLWRPEVGLKLGRPRPSAAFVGLPLVGAGAVWLAAVVLDRLPPAETDLARLTALALVLSGPATSVAAIMARAWWPRLVGLVVTGGLAATVFIGRALFGA